jgi:hypothetical protein
LQDQPVRVNLHPFRARIALSIFLAVTGLAATASAQGTGGAGGGTGTLPTEADFLIVVQKSPGVSLPDFDLQRFFNVANCQCNVPVYLYFTLTQTGFADKPTFPEGTIEFWVGLACNDLTNGLRDTRCVKLGSQTLTTFVNNSGVVITTDTQTMSQNFGQPVTSTTGGTGVGGAGGSLGTGGFSGTGGVGGTGPIGAAACNAGIQFSQNIWALVTFSGSIPYNAAPTLAVDVDLAPPPPPPTLSVSPGNEALIVNWGTIDTASTPDFLGYQVLCDRGGELQVFNGAFGAGYDTCPTAPLPPGPDANLLGRDVRFACSPLFTTVTNSFRIKILQNDITYGVSVVTIDDHHNASIPTVVYGAPQPTLNFYDVYRNGDQANTMPGQQPEPGRATGGFCAVSGGDGSTRGGLYASLGGVTGVLGAAIALASRRRRRRKRP